MGKVTPSPSTVVVFLLVGCFLAVPSHSCYTCNPTPSPPPPPPPKPTPCPPPPSPSPPPPSPPPPSPPPPSPPPPPKVVPCPPPPSPPPPPPKVVPCPPPPSPPPPPKVVPCPPPPAATGTCPIDTLKLSGCVDILGGLVHLIIGQSANSACCPVLAGVADLDAALCLCTTIRAKLLNVNVVLPLALQVLVNDCGKHVPSDYQCPAY